MKKIYITLCLLLCVACGTASTNNSVLNEQLPQTDDNVTEVGNPLTEITGVAVKGPVSGAGVDVYRLFPNGSMGDIIGSTTTNEDGTYSISGDISGPVVITITGGSYIDEATGQVVENNSEYQLMTVLADISAESYVVVTPLTTIASARALALIKENFSELADTRMDASSDVLLLDEQQKTDLEAAYQNIAYYFGIDAIDLVRTGLVNFLLPDQEIDPAGVSALYGVVVAALSQIMLDFEVTPDQLMQVIKGIAADYSDGVFDNLDHGEFISFGMVDTFVVFTYLDQAIRGFLDGQENNTGLTYEDFNINIPPLGQQ